MATAFDSEGNESDYSDEVTAIIKPKAPMLISVVQTALAAPARAVSRIASLFREKKQLRMISR